MASLPQEFTGVRSASEAERDLVAIATARPPLGHAHVVVDRDDGELLQRSGQVSVDAKSHGPAVVSVDQTAMFEFDRELCRGGWLSARDDACYYELSIDLGWGCVRMSDAYNNPGTSRLEERAHPMPRLGRRGFREWSQAVADLRAIANSDPPLNEAQGWRYDSALGPQAPEGPVTLRQTDEHVLLIIDGTTFADVGRSAFRGAWLRLTGGRTYLEIDTGEATAITVSALDETTARPAD